LFAAFIGKFHVGRASKTILGREHRGAVSDQKNSGMHIELRCKRGTAPRGTFRLYLAASAETTKNDTRAVAAALCRRVCLELV
jgi:hypothetical protein